MADREIVAERQLQKKACYGVQERGMGDGADYIKGWPENGAGRLEKEIRVYDLLDSNMRG